jgi:hypothetical protein
LKAGISASVRHGVDGLFRELEQCGNLLARQNLIEYRGSSMAKRTHNNAIGL